MNKLIIKMIEDYQSVPHKPRCRFNPSCSTYCKTCYERFNFFHATFLSIKRVLKCNPLFKPAYDPVPEKKEKKKKEL